MRRSTTSGTARTAAVLAVLALAGCARPAGTDGELTDGWPMLAAAKVPEPVVGECHDSNAYKEFDAAAYEGPFPLVDCAQPHQLEVVATGPLPAELAKPSERPGHEAFAALYPQCEQAAAKYLGGDWQTGRVYLYLQPPTYAQWRGGARFYHCDVVETGDDGELIVKTGQSLKGALSPGGRLAQGCGTSSGASGDTLFTAMAPTPCDQPHDMEFVGYVQAPAKTAYPSDDKANDDLFGTACENKMLAYMGMSRASYGPQQDLYYIWWRPSGKTGWASGDHSSRCFFMLHNRKLNRSVKGVGDVKL